MNQKEVSKWLKGITILTGIAGLVFFLLVMPFLAFDVAGVYPEVAYLKWLGIIYGWGIGIMCYAILFQFWKVCAEIGRDNSFSAENARAFKMISRFSVFTAGLWFAGILFLSMIVHALGPAYGFFMLLLAFAFIVLAVLSAALSHLVYKSYEMRKENDLTI